MEKEIFALEEDIIIHPDLEKRMGPEISRKVREGLRYARSNRRQSLKPVSINDVKHEAREWINKHSPS